MSEDDKTQIYFTESGKSDEVLEYIHDMNTNDECEWKFVPVRDDWGITDEEYLVHLGDTKVLVTLKDDPPWPAKPSDAPKRAALSGWAHYPGIQNKDHPGHVNLALYRACMAYG